MSTYVVPRGSNIPIDVEFKVAGIPVTDALTAETTVQDISGSDYYLDWTDLTMKADPPGLQEVYSLTHMGSGIYSRPGGLSLASVTMAADVTILRARYTVESPTEGVFTSYDDFSLHIGDVDLIPTASNTTDPFALLKAQVARTFGETIQYTPQGESVVQIKAVIDRTPEIVDRNGVEVYMLMPLLKMREVDLPAGIVPRVGDTLLSTETGEGYTIAQPPQYDGRGGIKAELV